MTSTTSPRGVKRPKWPTIPEDRGLSRWVRDAACASRRDLPWTRDSHQVLTSEVRAMERVCAGCPVRSNCAVYARDTRVSGGFWAGRNRNKDTPYGYDTPSSTRLSPGAA